MRNFHFAMSRDEFVNYYARREETKQKRALFYDALRADSQLNIATFAIQHGLRESGLYKWLQLISGKRSQVQQKAIFKAPEFKTEDEFVNSSFWLRANSPGTEESRRAFYRWFQENRDKQFRKTYKELTRELGVSKAVIARWAQYLGGFLVKPKNCRRHARHMDIITALRNADRPLTCGELEAATGRKSLCRKFVVEAIEESGSPELYQKYVSSEAMASENYNELIHYLCEYRRKYGREPSREHIARVFFYMERPAIDRAFEEGKPIVLSQDETIALRNWQAAKDEEWKKSVTSEPYERDEDWLVRVEDEGYKGFEFTGEYWTRYRELWEKKRESELQRTESRIREDIRAGRDPLETQCYGPRPEFRKTSPIVEFIINVSNGAVN